MEEFSDKKIQSETNVVDEIMETIVQMNKDRNELEKNERFFEAAKIKEQLEKLGAEYVRISLIALRDRQRNEKEGLEAEYEKELQEMGGFWEDKLRENEAELKNIMQASQQRQREEIEKYENDLKQNLPLQGRMSPDILNLEFQIQKMIKDQRYNEAGILQKKLEILRNNCNQKINLKTEEKIKNMLETLMKKHENELLALEKKLNSEREELIKARERDFEKIHNKYKVFREKLEYNHNNDFLKDEKRLKSFKPTSNFLIQ